MDASVESAPSGPPSSENGSSRGFFRAPADLREHVQFGFALSDYRPREAGATVRRLPTSRATIYYAADVRMAGSSQLMTGIFCEGPHTAGFHVGTECGEMVAFKIRPGALRALLGVPAKELRDHTVSMADVWGAHTRDLVDRMANARSPDARAGILQEELARRARHHGGADPVAADIAGIIERRAGKVQIADLIERSGFSQRSLLTKFDEWVGVTPKQYARATRLRAAMAELADGVPEDWAGFALRCGYCDQSHMIHEFQDMVGLPPGRYVEQRVTFSPRSGPTAGRRALPAREQRLYESVGMVSAWV
jgi:AraC-like DNA-binding protein